MDIFIAANGGEPLISAGVLNSVVIVVILCLFFIIASSKIKKADPQKPSIGLVFIMELLVTSMEGICKSIMGHKNGKFGPFIGTLIIYLVIANLFGLFGLTPPTSNYNVTLGLAIFALTYLAISAIKTKGFLRYLRETFVGDFPILLPLNIIGEVSKVVSLSLRLFVNILSGSMISFVLLQLAGGWLIIVMPFLNFYFDIFAGLIQTVIFSFLVMIWLEDAVATTS